MTKQENQQKEPEQEASYPVDAPPDYDFGDYPKGSIKQTLASFIWWLSETSGIGLGRLAPVVLGWKLGSKGERIR